MLERLKKFGSDVRVELDSKIGGSMIWGVLQAEERIWAEKTYVERIKAAISFKEIHFISRYPLNPPKEPVDLRLAKFAGLEDRGFIVFLVVNREWLRKVWWLNGPEEKEYLYGKLKQTLRVIDKIRGRGDIVLDGDGIQAIKGKLKDQEQAELLD